MNGIKFVSVIICQPGELCTLQAEVLDVDLNDRRQFVSSVIISQG